MRHEKTSLIYDNYILSYIEKVEKIKKEKRLQMEPPSIMDVNKPFKRGIGNRDLI